MDPGMVFQGWLDTRRLPFPGERDRTCDTVADIADTNRPGQRLALVIEFQSEAQPITLHRVLEYLGRLNLELRTTPQSGTYAVAGALLDLTGPEQPDTLHYQVPGWRSTSCGCAWCRSRCGSSRPPRPWRRSPAAG
jgi:hypothetical protein